MSTMSTAGFCDLHSQPINSFCGTHVMPCCASCHSLAYPECKHAELSKAIAQFKAEIKEYESGLDILISEAKDKQESVPDWLTKHDGRQKDMMTEVQNLFSEVRRVVDDCEQKILNRFRDVISKHTLAGRSMDKIVNVLSELKKERPELSSQEAESRTCEGAAINPGGEDTPVDSQATYHVTAAQSGESLNKHAIKLHQAVSNSKSLLRDFEDLSPIDYEAVINKGVLDSVEKILNDSCDIAICQKPISEFKKELELSCDGTRSVMTFLNKSATSDMIVASYNRNRLRVVTQSGTTTKFVDLENNYQPHGVCHLNDRIYVTHHTQNQISVYQTSDLSYQASFPVSGGCVGIVFVGERLIVASPDDRCVRALTTSGNVIAQSSHAFQQPWDVAVHTSPAADALVVTDTNAREVVLLSPNLATHIKTIPCGGFSPMGVCVFGANIYVCNSGSNNVMELSRDGQRRRSVILRSGCVGICVNPARLCFMVSTGNNDSITSYLGQL